MFNFFKNKRKQDQDIEDAINGFDTNYINIIKANTTYKRTKMSNFGLKLNSLYSHLSMRKIISITILAALFFGTISVFFVKNVGIYNFGLAAFGQSAARIIVTAIKADSGITVAIRNLIDQFVFWVLYIILSIPIFIFGYKKIGKVFTALTVLFLAVSSLVSFSIGLIPGANDVYLIGNFDNTTVKNVLPEYKKALSGIIPLLWSDGGNIIALMIYSIAYGYMLAYIFAIIQIIGGTAGVTGVIGEWYANEKQKSFGSISGYMNIIIVFISVLVGSWLPGSLLLQEAKTEQMNNIKALSKVIADPQLVLKDFNLANPVNQNYSDAVAKISKALESGNFDLAHSIFNNFNKSLSEAQKVDFAKFLFVNNYEHLDNALYSSELKKLILLDNTVLNEFNKLNSELQNYSDLLTREVQNAAIMIRSGLNNPIEVNTKLQAFNFNAKQNTALASVLFTDYINNPNQANLIRDVVNYNVALNSEFVQLQNQYNALTSVTSKAWTFELYLSPNFVATVLTNIVYIIVLNKLYPKFKLVRVEIFSNLSEEIKNKINSDRKIVTGMTMFKAEGGYKGEEFTVVTSIALFRHVMRLIKDVRKVDPDAFISISDVTSIDGYVYLPKDKF
ncbi:DUF2179 domain-containing protein [Mycoplasma corogypsi]|uniref:DUF2179 domain-containing protein n=1 Tax=Mycoplasma corogypsi TaxID=2106 RepID=UPI0038737A7D